MYWCGRGDSNPHECYLTATSTLRVYQFRHDRVVKCCIVEGRGRLKRENCYWIRSKRRGIRSQKARLWFTALIGMPHEKADDTKRDHSEAVVCLRVAQKHPIGHPPRQEVNQPRNHQPVPIQVVHNSAVQRAIAQVDLPHRLEN